MEKETLLDKMQKTLFLKENDTERASQILSAIDGMSIKEARELLEICTVALNYVYVSYSTSRDETTL